MADNENVRRREPPSWMYRQKRPDDDVSYFENMTRIVFMAGFSWKAVGDRWPEFRKAFKDFDFNEVAKFGDEEVERLLTNPGIVRNRAKIIATIENARVFREIVRERGSFGDYIDTLDKDDNYAGAIEEISKRFRRMGTSSSRIFLFSVGEDVHHADRMNGL